MMRRGIRIGIVVLLLVGIFSAAWFIIDGARIRALEDKVERAVITTLQRESPEQFFVTGRLDVTATAQVTTTRIFLPDVLDLEIGSASARVRAPGRIAYGFDAAGIEADDVRIHADGTVEVVLPELRVYSVDPDLGHLEIETQSGWFRPAGGEQRVTAEALRSLRDGLEAQAAAHLQDSIQPRVNTAKAIQTLLEPVLRAAGVKNPKVRVIGMGEVISEPIG